jgi:hypothetical protein
MFTKFKTIQGLDLEKCNDGLIRNKFLVRKVFTETQKN